jgi:hypothetical protein
VRCRGRGGARRRRRLQARQARPAVPGAAAQCKLSGNHKLNSQTDAVRSGRHEKRARAARRGRAEGRRSLGNKARLGAQRLAPPLLLALDLRGAAMPYVGKEYVQTYMRSHAGPFSIAEREEIERRRKKLNSGRMLSDEQLLQICDPGPTTEETEKMERRERGDSDDNLKALVQLAGAAAAGGEASVAELEAFKGKVEAAAAAAAFFAPLASQRVAEVAALQEKLAKAVETAGGAGPRTGMEQHEEDLFEVVAEAGDLQLGAWLRLAGRGGEGAHPMGRPMIVVSSLAT